MMNTTHKIGPALSPVNYDAWYREGYMPPSEHLLIDRLQRGAKVIASTSGDSDGVWLVVQGEMTRKKIVALGKWFHMQLEILDEPSTTDIVDAVDMEKPSQPLRQDGLE